MSNLEDIFVFPVVHGVIVHIYFVDVTTYTIAATSQFFDSSTLVGQPTVPRYLFDSRVDGCCMRSGLREIRHQIMEQSLVFLRR